MIKIDWDILNFIKFPTKRFHFWTIKSMCCRFQYKSIYKKILFPKTIYKLSFLFLNFSCIIFQYSINSIVFKHIFNKFSLLIFFTVDSNEDRKYNELRGEMQMAISVFKMQKRSNFNQYLISICMKTIQPQKLRSESTYKACLRI